MSSLSQSYLFKQQRTNIADGRRILDKMERGDHSSSATTFVKCENSDMGLTWLVLHLIQAEFSARLNTVQTGYCDYHLVTKIEYYDYRDRLKGLSVVARSLFLLLLTCSA